MSSDSLSYQLHGAAWRLRFCAEALNVLQRAVQRDARSKESVGQLYSRDLTTEVIVVDLATRLSPERSWLSKVVFDPKKAMAERVKLFADGLHCIGFWHTHPEPLPRPSAEDLQLAKDHALAARDQLSGLVFVIVGNAHFPDGLRVWVHDGRDLRPARSVST